MSHWLDGVVTLLKSESSDLRELALMVGGDPRTFYKGTKITAAVLHGQDMEGMEFDSMPPSLNDKLGNENEVLFYVEQLISQKRWLDALEVFEIEESKVETTRKFYRRWLYVLRQLRDRETANEVISTLKNRFVLEQEDYITIAAFYKRGSNERISIYLEGYDQYPNSDSLAADLAKELVRSDGFENAEDVYERLLSVKGDRSKIWLAFSEYFLQRGRLDKAASVLMRGIDTIQGDASPAVHRLTLILLQTGSLVEAEKILREHIDIRPNASVLTIDLARILARRGYPEEAIVLLNLLASKHKSDVGIWKSMGDIAARYNSKDRARIIFEEAAEKFPEAKFISKWIRNLDRSKGPSDPDPNVQS